MATQELLHDPLNLSEESESESEDDQIHQTQTSNKSPAATASKTNGKESNPTQTVHINIEDIKEVIVDTSQLNPLSPEVISKQATINIGIYLLFNQIQLFTLNPLSLISSIGF